MRKSFLSFLLVLIAPVVIFAQDPLPEEEKSRIHQRIDSLAKENDTLDKIIKQLRKFKVSAYMQVQYQHGQEMAGLDVGADNEHDGNFNRFGFRRGRFKFEYKDGIGKGAMQIEVNDEGVSFRDLYVGAVDPWTKRQEVMIGIFNRPFGHEVNYSTSGLETPERSTVIRNFFPDERDLGFMFTFRTPKADHPLHFLKLDAGLFAGNSIHRDTDSRKDFIGRLSGKDKIGNWGEWGAGFSFYHGHVMNTTSTAYEMQGNKFVAQDMGETGTYMLRQYYGLDAQFSFRTGAGRTTLRAEGLIGQQPGIANSSRSPNSGDRLPDEPENSLYARPFLGAIFYAIQDIGTSPFSVLAKYDLYDPNTKTSGDNIGAENSFTSRTDLKLQTLGIGALYRVTKHIRLQALYEFKKNETSKHVEGFEQDRPDNVFTFRVQYKF